MAADNKGSGEIANFRENYKLFEINTMRDLALLDPDIASAQEFKDRTKAKIAKLQVAAEEAMSLESGAATEVEKFKKLNRIGTLLDVQNYLELG